MNANKNIIYAVGAGALAIAAMTAIWLSSTPVKADPFTGCYIGAGAGYGASNTDVSATDGFNTIGIDGIGSTGFAGNLTAGCDRQFERVVVGIYGDYVWHDSDTEIYFPGNSIDVIGLDTQWTIGARLGYVVAPTTMVYALAGYTELDTGGLASIGTLDGYQLGGGIESGLGSGWFVDARYTVSMLDQKNIALGGPFSVGIEPEVHVGRVGLSYRFNFDPTAALK